MGQLSELKGERVVVTGGAGFVGSNVVQRLVALGARVVVLDDFFTGTLENLPKESANVEVVRGSVADPAVVRDVLRQTPYVVHEAARNIIASTKNPREDFESNIGGTLNVLMAAREVGVRRVVYASSASIYGNARQLPTTEDEAPNILNPYACSKYAGESYCKAFYETYGLSVSAVRYSNVYGTMQRPDNPYCGVVSKFFAAALTAKPLLIHGDGEQTRDYTYVEDAVEATLIALVAPKAEGRVFNIGTSRETSVNALARAILELTGSKSAIQHVDRRDIDNIRRRVLSVERIRGDLRWSPSVTLEAGLRKTHEWLMQGRSGLAS